MPQLRRGNLTRFRRALLDVAGGFTEVPSNHGTRYIVGLEHARAKPQLEDLLRTWGPQSRSGKITLEERSGADDPDDIFFLLPLKKNPDRRGRRGPLFTNEQFDDFLKALARMNFQLTSVLVYGEWRKGRKRYRDRHHLLRVRRRDEHTVSLLRGFIQSVVLAAPGCDQECIYLSSNWCGELVEHA